MILEKLIHFISYIKQDCLYNCNIFSNKHLEIYPNRVYNIKRKGGNHMEEKKECCCHHKTKERSDKEYKDLIIKKMVENDTYCTDILVQVSAVNAALNSFNKVLLANHIRTCVAEDIREGKDETIDELVKVLQKLMK